MAYTDRFPIVKNFLETKLTADCDAGETTLYLENVDGLPTILSGRDYVPLVLRDAGTVREIVYVDAVDNTAGTIWCLAKNVPSAMNVSPGIGAARRTPRLPPGPRAPTPTAL